MKIAIIGGGIGGLTIGRLLSEQNHEIIIYEKLPNLSHGGAAIIIGANVLNKFKKHQISKEIIKYGFQLNDMIIKNEKNKVLSTIYNPEPHSYSIKRETLMNLLCKNIDPKNIIFNAEIEIQNHENHVTVVNHYTNKATDFDYCIIADGARSNSSKQFFRNRQLIYQNQICLRGLINNTIKIEKATEIWAKEARLGLIPLPDDELYWFVTTNEAEDNYIQNKLEILNLIINHEFPQFNSLFKEVEEDFIIVNKLYDINPLDNFVDNRIILLGDAAHATTPNMGQGACQAMEDAITISNLFSQQLDPKTFKIKYNNLRVKHTKKVILSSRSLGKIATSKNGFIIFLRNYLLPLIPKRIANKQNEWLYNNKIN